MQKENYFSSATRKEKISDWQQKLKNYKSRPSFTFSIDNATLLVLDMQNYFLNEDSHAFIPVSKEITTPISHLITYFTHNNRPIIFTKHKDNTKSEEPNNLMLKFWKSSIQQDSEFSKITKQLDYKNALILQKSKYSAFYKTNLEKLLQEKEINQLVITGVHTHLCCESTARDAFIRNFEVFFIIDATGTYTEDLHLGTLKALTHGFAVCLPSEEIIIGK